jgi:hypothetical protein
MLTIRLITYILTLPSPLSPDIRAAALPQLLPTLINTGHHLLNFLCSLPVSHVAIFPAHLHKINAVAVCAAQRMIRQAFKLGIPVEFSDVQPSVVVLAEERLKELGMGLPVVINSWNAPPDIRAGGSRVADGPEGVDLEDWADLWQTLFQGSHGSQGVDVS